MADFPLAALQDAAQFGFEQEDKGIRSEMEGGYVLTRPRFTGKPRRTWKTGFTDLSNTDKQTFESFFSIYGTYQSFNYTVPTGEGIVVVRFKQAPKYDYKGIGSNFRWNITDITFNLTASLKGMGTLSCNANIPQVLPVTASLTGQSTLTCNATVSTPGGPGSFDFSVSGDSGLIALLEDI
jgi:phage-related protein